MEFEYFGIILSSLFAFLWIMFVKRQWAISSQQRKKVLAFFASLAILTWVVSIGIELFGKLEYRPIAPFIVLIISIPLDLVLVCMVKRWWKRIALFLLEPFCWLVIFSALIIYNVYNVRHSDLNIQDEEIRQIPMLHDLPEYKYADAWTVESIFYVRYNWVHPEDSIACREILARIKRTYPEQCNWFYDSFSENFLYSTHYEGKKPYVVTAIFYTDHFILSYREMEEGNAQPIMADELAEINISLPAGRLEGYVNQDYGPDWERQELYKFNRPIGKAELKNIQRACHNNKHWKYEKKDKNITLRRDINDDRQEVSLTFMQNDNGQYQYVKTHVIDYLLEQ